MSNEMSLFLGTLEGKLQKRKDQNTLRILVPKNPISIDFSSNDYLSIAQDTAFLQAFYQNFALPMGASGARLVAVQTQLHWDYEKKLETHFGKAALFFNSGFLANLSFLSSLYDKNDVIFCDQYNHSSIYEGILSSGARLIRYRHLDLKHLEKLLEKYRADFKNALIISETLFSITGDFCDLSALIELKKKYQTQLYMDEAHSFGIFGGGLGFVAQQKKLAEVDFLMVGLGKAAASMGGVLLSDRIVKEYLINFAKGFIYSTTVSPMQMAWNHLVFDEILQREKQRKHLFDLVDFFAQRLSSKYDRVFSKSPIFPIPFVEQEKFQKMQKAGLGVYLMKPPAMPQTHLRIVLNAQLNFENIEKLLHYL